MAWTDERMDDLANRMDARFDRVDRDLRDLRVEIGGVRDELKGDTASLRDELKGDIGSLRDELKGDTASLRDELKGDTAGLRGDLKDDISGLRTELKGDIAELRATMMRFGIGLIVGMAGVIATLLGAIATGTLGA